MYSVKIPKVINFGPNALSETEYPKNALIITTASKDLSHKWIDKMGIQDYILHDTVEPEPSIDNVNDVISKHKSKNLSAIIGLGGGQLTRCR